MQHFGLDYLAQDEDDSPQSVPQPERDAFFDSDDRIIEDLLNDQIRYRTLPAYCYGETVASAIYCRRTLLNWIREVCDHRNAPTEVLAHTIQLIDRFVSQTKTDKREYQLVGAACLLISTKLKETVPVSVEDLVRYSDFSITKEDICMKELLISISLKYDLSMITVTDFIKPLVDRCPVDAELNRIIRHCSSTLYHKVAHVEGLNWYLPSYVASSCILYATQLLDLPQVCKQLIQQMRVKFITLLDIDPNKLDDALRYFQSLFDPGTADVADHVRRADCGDEPVEEILVKSNHPSSASNVPDTPPETSSSYHSNTSTSSGQGVDVDSNLHETNTEGIVEDTSATDPSSDYEEDDEALF
nr:G1:S specific cyclin D1 [Hymenolepis microstoma]